MSTADSIKSYLVVGWKTDSDNDKRLSPRYWSNIEARQGEQCDDDLFRVEAATIAQHTAIIAQSGSGKSFFMGRLIEEILLRTKAKCLIFDPNADFRRVNQIESNLLWTKPADRGGEKLGQFTHEKDRHVFAKHWEEMKIRVLTGRGGQLGPDTEPLQLWWPMIPAQLLARDLPPFQQIDFHYCHETLESLGFLLEQKAIDYDEGIDLVDEARILFRQARTKSASINPKYKEILIVYNEGGRTLPSFWRIQPWHGTPSLGSHCHANLAGAMSQMSFGPRPNPFCPSMFARPREVDHPHPIGRSSMESCMS